MTDKPNSFETIERPERGDKSGFHEFVNTPDFQQPLNPEMAEFIYRANSVLKKFRQDWIATHDGSWAKDLEMDVIPLWSSGMVCGYLAVSEIDGESYDYLPAKQVERGGDQ